MENTEVIEEFNNIIEKIDAVIKGDVQLRLEYADDMANAFKKEKKVVKVKQNKKSGQSKNDINTRTTKENVIKLEE